MGLSIAEIRQLDTRRLALKIKDKELPFDYTPAGFTPELESLTMNPDTGEILLNTPSILAMVNALIVDIDLTEDAPASVVDKKTGKERPYDAAKDGPLKKIPKEIAIQILPKSYLMGMIMEVVADLNPKLPSESSSESSSGTAPE